jgi:Fe2+ or Zn2+ uptake regulation protein
MQHRMIITERQNKIRQFISKEISVKISDILIYFEKESLKISRFSVVRDLNTLIQGGFIEKKGDRRHTIYKECDKHPLHTYVDTDQYFQTPQEKRVLASQSFGFDVFEKLENIFSEKEIMKLPAASRRGIIKNHGLLKRE